MASVSDPWVAVRMECTARVGRGLAAHKARRSDVAGLYIAVWWSKRRGPEGAASRTVYRFVVVETAWALSGWQWRWRCLRASRRLVGRRDLVAELANAPFMSELFLFAVHVVVR